MKGDDMKAYKQIFTIIIFLNALMGFSCSSGGGDPEPVVEVEDLAELVGSLFDAKDGSGLSGARVVVFEPAIGGSALKGEAAPSRFQAAGEVQQCPQEGLAEGFTDEKGYYVVVVPADKILNLCFSKDDYIVDNYFNVTVLKEETGELEDVKLVNSRFGGLGEVTGSIVSASDTTDGVTEARIDFRNGINNFTGETAASVFTDGDGVFFAELEAGNYSIFISKPGFESVQQQVLIFGGELIVLERIVLLESDLAEGRGELEGTVYDAFTGNTLSGVNLNLRPGTNTFDGAVSFEDFTDSIGRYALAPTAGYYTVEAVLNQYNASFLNAVVIFGRNSRGNNFSILPVLAETSEQITVVLSWIGPQDYDVVLDYDLTEGSGRIFPGFLDPIENTKNPEDFGSSTAFPFIELLMDTRSGGAPETLVISRLDEAGIYTYKVRDPVNADTTSLVQTSRAKVQVYRGNRLLTTYSVPPELEEGISWRVFEIDAGEIITLNDAEQPQIR